MAEYIEVIKQFKRLCKSINPAKCTRGECPMGCENIGQCRKVAFERPEKFEEQVMAWAAEHPEPVYPTWKEWLVKLGIVSFDVDFHSILDTRPTTLTNTVKAYINEEGSKPIPADIAQKLGIEPKEV